MLYLVTESIHIEYSIVVVDINKKIGRTPKNTGCVDVLSLQEESKTKRFEHTLLWFSSL